MKPLIEIFFEPPEHYRAVISITGPLAEYIVNTSAFVCGQGTPEGPWIAGKGKSVEEATARALAELGRVALTSLKW